MIIVSAFIPRGDGAPPDWDAIAKRLVAALHEDIGASEDIDTVSVALRTGFNIGIARSYKQVVRQVSWRTDEVTQRVTPSLER